MFGLEGEGKQQQQQGVSLLLALCWALPRSYILGTTSPVLTTKPSSTTFGIALFTAVNAVSFGHTPCSFLPCSGAYQLFLFRQTGDLEGLKRVAEESAAKSAGSPSASAKFSIV